MREDLEIYDCDSRLMDYYQQLEDLVDYQNETGVAVEGSAFHNWLKENTIWVN